MEIISLTKRNGENINLEVVENLGDDIIRICFGETGGYLEIVLDDFLSVTAYNAEGDVLQNGHVNQMGFEFTDFLGGKKGAAT